MKTKIKLLMVSLLIIVLNSCLIPDALAAELMGTQNIIEDASNKIKLRMQDKVFAGNFKEVTGYVDSVINPYIDFDLISSLVLGKFWKTASPAEQKGFEKEFKVLLIRSYSRGFVEFKNWSISFLPVEITPDAKKVVIKTKIIQPGMQAVAVDYRMVLFKGSWRVYDILIDGVSLVTTYRSSFQNDIEKTGSLQGIIDQLTKRNAEAFSTENN